ncbi:MAG: NAD(P)-dependent oxidoreductase [Saprospiraceae bacterium]|nr:NAD(P)-dependent oxidoreductase [Saprospiraceae bacterium]MBP7699043.1 NAD(P)-dependent oxidoreductase [Saprospiraceae bacterium]
MKILVTGGTGFIGNHLVKKLLSDEHELVVTATSAEKAKKNEWFNHVQFEELDITNVKKSFFEKCTGIDKVIHLIWSGLPNYKDLFHVEENLMPQYFFIKNLVQSGITDITITGTCFEYGMNNGALAPDRLTDPQNPYALAKDTLRKFLQQLQQKHPFKLKWLRLFYMFGEGQSEKSILSLLDKALANGDTTFNMSGGEQLRDYLPIEEVVKQIANYAVNQEGNCISNICSGMPISIRNLVENYLKKNNKSIFLNLGYYPYPDYEPMAFWGKC